MNYRHAFHAGNFADLVKHGALLALLARMTAGPAPLRVFDTHAGRGLYDLEAPEAHRSGEAEAGIARLMTAADLPEPLVRLRAAVQRANPGGGARFYPGSPWLIAEALRSGDSYQAFELRAEEHAALARVLKGRPGASSLCADGYGATAERLAPAGAALVLIDPPFERPDDYRRVVQTLAAVQRRNPAAVVLVWLPLKDLETFDAFLRDAEAAQPRPLLVAEIRLRPLDDPMRMNGCALVALNPPEGFGPILEEVGGWTVRALGEHGEARVWLTS